MTYCTCRTAEQDSMFLFVVDCTVTWVSLTVHLYKNMKIRHFILIIIHTMQTQVRNLM